MPPLKAYTYAAPAEELARLAPTSAVLPSLLRETETPNPVFVAGPLSSCACVHVEPLLSKKYAAPVPVLLLGAPTSAMSPLLLSATALPKVSPPAASLGSSVLCCVHPEPLGAYT